MLQLFTLQEAIDELAKRTALPWSESMVFDAALRLDLELRAAPPRQTTVAVWTFVIGEGLVKKMGGLPWALAILYPQNIAELWQTGEAEVTHAVHRMQTENEYHWFEEPVVVSVKDVRVTAAVLDAIVESRATPTPAAKPLETRERNTLLSIIGVLCKEAGYDCSRPAKAAANIQSTAAQMGISLGESTIEGHLKKVADALATRMK